MPDGKCKIMTFPAPIQVLDKFPVLSKANTVPGGEYENPDRTGPKVDFSSKQD